MATEWNFLEPWRVALRGSLAPREKGHATAPTLKVWFDYPHSCTSLMRPPTYIRLQGDQRDPVRLQRLREAMELFTLLAFVNYTAFNELMASLSVATRDKQVEYPTEWDLRLFGTLSPQDIAATQAQVTWGAFLGFPEDPRKYSSEFRAAAEKLEVMGAGKATLARPGRGCAIYWKCKVHDTKLEGRLGPGQSAASSNSIRDQIRSLFDIAVPPIVRLCATQHGACLLSTWIPAKKPCEVVIVILDNWDHPAVSELSSALARTAIEDLSIDLDSATMNSRQATLNAGLLMNSLVCGNLVRLVSETSNIAAENPIPLVIQKHTLACWRICNGIFNAICSAVSELSVDSHLASLLIDLEGSGRWPWLVYAICGGTSDVVVPRVEIWKGTLTRTDILAMRAALRANYPLPVSEADLNSSHQYGFVEIEEGTELQLCGALGGEDDSSIVVASACRCRALFDPNDSEWINLVVPGYGACKAKVGDRGVRFTADTGNISVCLDKRVSGALEIFYVQFETPDILTDLLVLITRALRSLKLYFKASDSTPASHVDLCALARACPELLRLSLKRATAVVSEHDASLRLWPVKTIGLVECSCTLSDLVGCLRDPELRMARELVQLEVTPRTNQVFADEEVRELITHNGEFLPVVKEKLPMRSKLAVISVGTAATWSTEQIDRLDSYILGLIFAFASTPKQRSVTYRARRVRVQNM